MLAQLQLRYGFANLARYEAAMVTVRGLFESQGIALIAGTVTRVGPLYEAWNLWKIEDHGHLERALGAMTLGDSEALAALTELDATVEHEQTRFLGSLAFAGSLGTDCCSGIAGGAGDDQALKYVGAAPSAGWGFACGNGSFRWPGSGAGQSFRFVAVLGPADYFDRAGRHRENATRDRDRSPTP